MTADSKSVSDLMDRARGMVALNPMIEPHMEQFWKAQDNILKEAEAYSRSWFQRRHEATQSALETVRKANGDGADPMRAMVDWQQASFQRLSDDVQEWIEMCSRCAGRLSEAEVEAGKEGAEEAAKRTKSAAKTKHATPV